MAEHAHLEGKLVFQITSHALSTLATPTKQQQQHTTQCPSSSCVALKISTHISPSAPFQRVTKKGPLRKITQVLVPEKKIHEVWSIDRHACFLFLFLFFFYYYFFPSSSAKNNRLQEYQHLRKKKNHRQTRTETRLDLEHAHIELIASPLGHLQHHLLLASQGSLSSQLVQSRHVEHKRLACSCRCRVRKHQLLQPRDRPVHLTRIQLADSQVIGSLTK